VTCTIYDEYADESEPPRSMTITYPVSAKHYLCIECGAIIGPGERYECVRAIWDEKWSTVRTCRACATIRSDMVCGGFAYGNLAEMLREYGLELV
jgi:hypothetical protein